MKMWFVFAAVLTAAISCRATARAATELCGAHLRPMVAVPSTNVAAPQLYGYVLQALSPRSAEGGIVADTDHGWFEWSFPSTALVAHPDHMNINGVEADGRDYESTPLYVAFPAGTVVRHAWVERAQSHGDAMFDFDKRGMAHCLVPDFADSDVHGPVVLPAPPATIAAMATPAKPTDARFDKTCDHPFTKATVSNVPRIEPPVEMSGPATSVTISIVAVSAESKVLDVWTVGSSGDHGGDIAVQSALHFAKYQAPISYCVHVDTLLYLTKRVQLAA